MPRNTPAYVTPPVDAFGEGGFRIAGERVEGAVMIIGQEVRPWTPGDGSALSPEDFEPVFAPDPPPDVVVLGTGARLAHPPAAVRQAFRERRIGLETLDTGSACRLYNILAGEARRVFAAFLPV